MALRDPPAQILQVRADLAKAKHSRYRSALRSRSVPTSTPATPPVRTPRPAADFERRHTATAAAPKTSRSANSLTISPSTTGMRSRSAPKRAATSSVFSTGTGHGHSASTSVSSVPRDKLQLRTPSFPSPGAGLRFTPTKAELSKIRNDLATDKSTFAAAYPVPPSPVQLGGGGGTPGAWGGNTPRTPQRGGDDGDKPPVPTRYLSPSPAGKVATQTATILARTVAAPPPTLQPAGGGTSNALLEAVQDELASVRRELEAEKQHSEALRSQAKEAAATWDAKVKEHKNESARLEGLLKKAEAKGAQAVADREELRKRMSVEIADLKRELDERKKDIRSLQGALVHHQEQQHRQQLLLQEEQGERAAAAAAATAAAAQRQKQLPSIVRSTKGGAQHTQAGNANAHTAATTAATPQTPTKQEVSSLAHGYPLPKLRAGEVDLRELANEQATLAKKNRTIRWSAEVAYKEPSPIPRMDDSSPSSQDSSDEDPIIDVDDDLRRDLHDMFDEYDTDATGFLPRARVQSAFREMERTFGLEERPIHFPHDSDGDDDADREGLIDFKTFVQIMSVLPSRLARETELCLADMDEEDEGESPTVESTTADDTDSNSGSF